jgi:di/tricarboxylate transporter
MTVVYTLAIALGLVVLEGYLTFASRVTRDNTKFPLHLDDATWWIEWVVAATVALAVFLVIDAHDHKDIDVAQIVTAIIAVFLGYSALPMMANIRCLDDEGKVKSVKWLIILNVAAIFILMAAVAVGAKIYG